jgi:DNA-binding transcriptional regulator YiaG
MNTAMLHIRTKFFRISQEEMARWAGVTQSTVSKWEAGTTVPLSTALKAIRNSAIQRGVPFDDRWFWEEFGEA